MPNTPLMQFSLHYTELLDLDAADPLRPTAAIHVEGPAARALFDAVGQHFSTYVVGRGPLPQGAGYSLLVSQGDYPALRQFLAASWPAMPVSFPARLPVTENGAYSQETCDVLNYLAKPPQRTPGFQTRAQSTLTTYVPPAALPATLYLCRWLRENMLPANNCFTLAALLARGLQALDLPAQFQTGQVHLTARGETRSVRHAWVMLHAWVIDLTLDHQTAWQGAAPAVNLLAVTHPQVQYAPVPAPQAEQVLAEYWLAYSKPAERPAYSATSLRQQSQVMRQIMGDKLYAQRQGWLTAVRTGGMLAGTHQWLLAQMGKATESARPMTAGRSTPE